MKIRMEIEIDAKINVRAECVIELLKKAKELLAEERMYSQAATVRDTERDILKLIEETHAAE